MAGDQVVIFRQQLADACQSACDHVVNDAVIRLWQFLGQLTDLQTRRVPDLPFIAGLFTVEQFEQARLAGAVASDQTHALTAIKLEAHLRQQRIEAVGQGNIGKRKQRHITPFGCSGRHSTCCALALHAIVEHFVGGPL